MNRVVHKFATGMPIPEDAKYLNTIVQTRFEEVRSGYQSLSGPDAGMSYPGSSCWAECFLVWHYYEVNA